MWAGVLLLTLLACSIGLILITSAARIKQSSDSPVERVNKLLPQSQCAQCGYPGCRPYAEAIIAGNAEINQCAPGGDALVTKLADLLGKTTTNVNPAYGTPGPLVVARIEEDACIGCALCIPACPVDAIVGAAKYTHTIIRTECTGCELCVAPCPVDCIVIEPLAQR